MMAHEIREAALAILRREHGAPIDGATAYQTTVGPLAIIADVEPENGRARLRIENEGRPVFRSWWEPDGSDEVAAVVSHGAWTRELMQAAL